MEDETERMRAELLKKEAELIKLKQIQIDMQISQLKREVQQVTQPPVLQSSSLMKYRTLSPASCLNVSLGLPAPAIREVHRRCTLPSREVQPLERCTDGAHSLLGRCSH